MKRAMQLITSITISVFVLSAAFSHEIPEEKIELKEKEATTGMQQRLGILDDEIIGVWEIHGSERGFLGLLVKGKNSQREPEAGIMLFDKSDNLIGRIDASGLLKPKGARRKYTKISKQGANLYLDALKVIDQIK